MNFKIFTSFVIVLLAIIPFSSSYDSEENPAEDEKLPDVASSDSEVESLGDERKGDKPP